MSRVAVADWPLPEGRTPWERLPRLSADAQDAVLALALALGAEAEVITDVLAAQTEMRKHVPGAGFCLMVATMLHSIAVGNLLPAWVKVGCVDINPSTVTKLMDRGSTQTVGIVSDAEPFLRGLTQELVV